MYALNRSVNDRNDLLGIKQLNITEDVVIIQITRGTASSYLSC